MRIENIWPIILKNLNIQLIFFQHDIILDRFFIDDKLSSFIPLPLGSYEIQTRWETDGVKRADVDFVIESYD